MSRPDAPDFNDNNFLKDWLERRYGNDVAMDIIHDISETAERKHALKMLYSIAHTELANDNKVEPRARRMR